MRAAQRTLSDGERFTERMFSDELSEKHTPPDGARFTGALELYAIDALDGNAVAPLGTAAAQCGIIQQQTILSVSTSVQSWCGAERSTVGGQRRDYKG